MATAQGKTAVTDEERLAELGYTQDLETRKSGFQNFAISFTIISVLSGALTLYGTGINYGGPLQQAIGWPIVSVFVIIVGLSMAELASAFPTAGGLYWWASRLGGPAWGWFTGWFNLIGEVAILAGIDYGAATFTTALANLWFHYNNDSHHIIYMYAAILILHAVLNIFSVKLVGFLNHVSAYWHVFGVLAIVVVLIVVPDAHQSVGWVFSKTVNNAAFGHSPFFFIFLLGFLQAQYTYTGFDASAHMSEETREASMTAAKGVVNSIVVSAIAGYALILALTFAIKDLSAVGAAGSFAVITVLEQALGRGGAEALLFIAVMGQLFCGMSAITASSRMLYAFSRDRATPGWRLWSKLNASHVPYLGVCLIALLAFLLALPAWSSQTAFVYVAITSIATIGLYIAYILPVFLRLRAGDDFNPGPWSLGRWYKLLDVIAILWVVFICVLFILPTTEAAAPWSSQFDLKSFNYAPAAVGIVIVLVGGWWLLSARKWFKGPIRTVDMPDDAPPPLESLPDVV